MCAGCEDKKAVESLHAHVAIEDCHVAINADHVAINADHVAINDDHVAKHMERNTWPLTPPLAMLHLWHHSLLAVFHSACCCSLAWAAAGGAVAPPTISNTRGTSRTLLGGLQPQHLAQGT